MSDSHSRCWRFCRVSLTWSIGTNCFVHSLPKCFNPPPLCFLLWEIPSTSWLFHHQKRRARRAVVWPVMSHIWRRFIKLCLLLWPGSAHRFSRSAGSMALFSLFTKTPSYWNMSFCITSSPCDHRGIQTVDSSLPLWVSYDLVRWDTMVNKEAVHKIDPAFGGKVALKGLKVGRFERTMQQLQKKRHC